METNNNQVDPVFVLGIARNGTTWLMNSLAKNDDIVTPSHWLHHGAHETNFAKTQKRVGTFESADEYIGFVGKWSMDDVFILAQAELSDYLSHRRRDYYELFFDLMDSFARKNGARYWAVKMDPDLFWGGGLDEFWSRVTERYRSPKLVSVKRNDDDAIRSYLNMEGSYHDLRAGRASAFALFLGYARQQYGYKVIGSFVKNNDGLFLRHEEMRYSLSTVESRLDRYLELKGSLGSQKEDLYKKNTSFSKGGAVSPHVFLQWLARRLAKIQLVARSIILLWALVKPEAEPAYHRIIKHQYMRGRLLKELESRKSFDLLEKLSGESEKEGQ